MIYCEQYSASLFHVIIRRKICIIFCIWNHVTVTRNTQTFYRSTNTHSAVLFAASLSTFISSPIHITQESWLIIFSGSDGKYSWHNTVSEIITG